MHCAGQLCQLHLHDQRGHPCELYHRPDHQVRHHLFSMRFCSTDMCFASTWVSLPILMESGTTSPVSSASALLTCAFKACSPRLRQIRPFLRLSLLLEVISVPTSTQQKPEQHSARQLLCQQHCSFMSSCAHKHNEIWSYFTMRCASTLVVVSYLMVPACLSDTQPRAGIPCSESPAVSPAMKAAMVAALVCFALSRYCPWGAARSPRCSTRRTSPAT